jgi:hypothetical protein
MASTSQRSSERTLGRAKAIGASDIKMRDPEVYCGVYDAHTLALARHLHQSSASQPDAGWLSYARHIALIGS